MRDNHSEGESYGTSNIININYCLFLIVGTILFLTDVETTAFRHKIISRFTSLTLQESYRTVFFKCRFHNFHFIYQARQI